MSEPEPNGTCDWESYRIALRGDVRAKADKVIRHLDRLDATTDLNSPRNEVFLAGVSGSLERLADSLLLYNFVAAEERKKREGESGPYQLSLEQRVSWVNPRDLPAEPDLLDEQARRLLSDIGFYSRWVRARLDVLDMLLAENIGCNAIALRGLALRARKMNLRLVRLSFLIEVTKEERARRRTLSLQANE